METEFAASQEAVGGVTAGGRPAEGFPLFQMDLLHLSHDAIFAWEQDGGIELWNRGATQLYGYEAAEAKGCAPEELLRSRYAATRESIQTALAEAGLWEGEACHSARNGREVSVSCRLQRLPLADGKLLILESDRDLTERKQLEREILEISGREQRRIGQDLHDDLCQLLAGTELLCRLLAQELEGREPHVAKEAEKVGEQIRVAIQRARMLARGLAPVAVETEGLAPALKELAATAEEMFRLECRFNGASSIPIQSQDAALHLYRIAQEAISNAVKHGRATHISIDLEPEGDRVRLRIGNNGLPLAQTSAESGMGLRIMQYRAGMIGGNVELRPCEGSGVELICYFPKDL